MPTRRRVAATVRGGGQRCSPTSTLGRATPLRPSAFNLTRRCRKQGRVPGARSLSRSGPLRDGQRRHDLALVPHAAWKPVGDRAKLSWACGDGCTNGKPYGKDERGKRMKKVLMATALGTALLLSGCSESTGSAAAGPAATPSEALPFLGPSGLELESEQAARASLEAQRVAAEAAAAEAAAVEAAAAEAAAAEARRIADKAAAAERAAEAPDDGYVSDGLESACSDGTASIEECFGPGADADNNGVADVNEQPQGSGEAQYEYLCTPESPGYAPEYC